jgi:glycosyltransferase 2 family protein
MVSWRTARVLMVGCGATLLTLLILRNDPHALFLSLTQFSWRILIVIAFPFTLINLLDTLGWRFAFRRDVVPLSALFTARLAGEAVNLTTPTASVGGEAVKAWLIRRHVSMDVSAPSVIVAKTTITIAQGLLLVLGLVCATWALPPDSRLLRVMQWGLVMEVLAVGGFVGAQVSGVFGGGGRLLKRFGIIGRESGGLARLDTSLSDFYRREPGRLMLSIGFHFLGWLASALETWLILRLLGIPVSFVAVTVIEAFSTAVRFATFIVPGSLGALEGGHIAIFVALGLTATGALSFSLIRRIREAAWVGIGFIALLIIRPERAAAPPAAATG